jgi:hypothetical protein
MTSTTGLLAGVLALGGAVVQATPFTTSFDHPRFNRRGADLISFRHDDAASHVPVLRSEPVNLQPIRPGRASKRARRGEQSPYELLSENSVYWAGRDGTVAELKVEMPGETEAFVDMEWFDEYVEAASCPRNGTGRVSIRFVDQDEVDVAGAIWNWVNEQVDNTFLLMVGAGDCGWNADERILYQVHGSHYDGASQTLSLDADSTTWRDALHSFDLSIGRLAEQHRSGAGGSNRDIFDDIGEGLGDIGEDIGDALDQELTPDFQIPFDSDFSGKGISFSMDGIELSGLCSTCTTKGAFDVGARFRVSLTELKEASLDVSTGGIDASTVVALTLKGDVTDTLYERALELIKYSPAGIAVPGVISIGPTVTVALKAGVNAIKGGVTLTVGGDTRLPASSAHLDFLDEAASGQEGWSVEFSNQKLEADVFIEASASTSLYAAVGLEISALGEFALAYRAGALHRLHD